MSIRKRRAGIALIATSSLLCSSSIVAQTPWSSGNQQSSAAETGHGNLVGDTAARGEAQFSLDFKGGGALQSNTHSDNKSQLRSNVSGYEPLDYWGNGTRDMIPAWGGYPNFPAISPWLGYPGPDYIQPALPPSSATQSRQNPRRDTNPQR